MNMAKIRKFLMTWILPPAGIRLACYLLSKCHRGRSTIGEYKKKAARLYVLGNGPSLTKDLERYGEEMMAGDRLVVNFMGLSSDFCFIKPTCYVFADPIFFVDPMTLPDVSRKKVVALLDVLVNKTFWSMTIVTFSHNKNTSFVKKVKRNPCIRVLYADGIVPVPPDIKDFLGWVCNRYSPPAQNVINMALYLGVVWRYPEIVLLGADTSFHEMVRMEQETNRLYMVDAHFYGVEKRYMYRDSEQRTPNTMSNFFQEVYTVFAWYDKLREFADWANVRIINASSYSWIDAFERK